MAEENPNEEEKDQQNRSEHTPPPSSPRKRKNEEDLLSNCHSCGLHSLAKSPQTLTDLRILDSQWRIVLLCSGCLRLVRSAANCSYCFSPIHGPDEESPFLNCRQCTCRVHVSCIPRQRRLFSPSHLDPESFVCVDCCPLTRFFGRRNPSLSFSRVSVEELMREATRKGTLAARAKEKAAKKLRIAKHAADWARMALDAVTRPGNSPPRSEDEVAEDEELAVRLHLAMNGSCRISSYDRAKAPAKNGRADAKAELCMQDKGFLDYWNPPAVKIEPKKEFASVEGNNIGTVLKYCRRALKLNGSMDLIEKSKGDDKLDRYLMKYIRKSKLKSGMDVKENQVVSDSQLTCSKTSSLSDAPLSSSSGCQS